MEVQISLYPALPDRLLWYLSTLANGYSACECEVSEFPNSHRPVFMSLHSFEHGHSNLKCHFRPLYQ